jgi:hypothetical protein
VEFHVHIDSSLLAMGAILFENVTKKNDQSIVYAFKLLNKIKQNYYTIERKALIMVFVLHKFKHYLLGIKFFFYVNHMALVYLVNKPQVSRKIARWLLLFLEYDFIVVYKLSKIHVVVDALSRLLDIIEPTCAPDQTIDASLFYTKPKWLKDVKFF